MASSIIGALRVVLGMDAGEFTKGTKKAGSSMDRLADRAKKLGSAIGAAFAVGQVQAFARNAVNAFGVQEDAIAAVEATLRSTGEAAGFTSKQLQGMASSLQEATTFGDEEILKKVTNNLLTFGNVIGPTFERAQAAALDLSAVLGQDLQSSAIQLGKALNDPVLGVTALSRVGISFTKQQKEQIKTLVESNKMLEAQGVILNEVELFYGQAAEAAAQTTKGKLTQAANAFGDAMEKIGSAIAPVILPAAQVIKSLSEAFQALRPETVKTIVVFSGVTVGLGAAAAAVGLFITAIGTLAGPIAIAVAAIAGLSAAIVTLREEMAALEDRSKESLTFELDDVNAEIAAIDKNLVAVTGRLESIGEGGLLASMKLSRAEAHIKELYERQIALLERRKELQLAIAGKGFTTSIEPVKKPRDETRDAEIAGIERQNAALQLLNQTECERQFIMEAMQTPYEKMIEQQTRLNELFGASAKDAGILARANEMAAAAMHNAYANAASAVSGALANLFNQSKGVAIANALINTYEAVTAALKNPPGPPFSYVYAAAALAQGMAQVQAIRSTNKSGGGGGGTTASSVAGGGSAATARTQSSQVFQLNLHGQNFRRDDVAGLMSQMNELMADGVKLNVRAA